MHAISSKYTYSTPGTVLGLRTAGIKAGNCLPFVEFTFLQQDKRVDRQTDAVISDGGILSEETMNGIEVENGTPLVRASLNPWGVPD